MSVIQLVNCEFTNPASTGAFRVVKMTTTAIKSGQWDKGT